MALDQKLAVKSEIFDHHVILIPNSRMQTPSTQRRRLSTTDSPKPTHLHESTPEQLTTSLFSAKTTQRHGNYGYF